MDKEWEIQTDIPNDDTCFYRLYTNAMMYDLFKALQAMYEMYGDMKTLFVVILGIMTTIINSRLLRQ